MNKNLETADRVVKLMIAVSIVVLYITRFISGPFATLLMFLAVLSLVIFVAKLIIAKTFID